MVWEYWSTRHLQQALDRIDESLLDDWRKSYLSWNAFNPTE